ncbi:hypothetical protein FNF29_06094 [Cafeteria roenbergensis]|uniref:Uncharacterized protein n=1 Tax=Cafeteria roenbergensis TaxID=33653 RepID=A0A5A8C960_CAFRO|nr:hypothetical protein FNF29_06094 [Cafeteria roenbergensis]|eukprot:KAA0149207.1 hypothetical protein FNF29_06094 [Cafeteria roenbergensis]
MSGARGDASGTMEFKTVDDLFESLPISRIREALDETRQEATAVQSRLQESLGSGYLELLGSAHEGCEVSPRLPHGKAIAQRHGPSGPHRR